MSHCYTIVDSYGVELCGIAPHALYLLLYDLTYLVQMGMPWHKLRERVDDSDNGLSELFTLHSCRHP